jgi:hypothetical protein
MAESSPAASPNEKKKAEETEEDEHESDVHVITRAVYRDNDDGYLDPKRPEHLWVVTAPHSADEKVEPRQLTRGRFDEGNALWSKDGTQIFFASRHVENPITNCQPRSFTLSR